jgi:hypothetical protein
MEEGGGFAVIGNKLRRRADALQQRKRVLLPRRKPYLSIVLNQDRGNLETFSLVTDSIIVAQQECSFVPSDLCK